MKVRRVGSVTCGILLILFGVLFGIHLFYPALSYEMIFRLWPCILIALGIEMLLAGRKQQEETIRYDGAAILLTIVLAFFAMGMGVVEFCIEHYPPGAPFWGL